MKIYYSKIVIPILKIVTADFLYNIDELDIYLFNFYNIFIY